MNCSFARALARPKPHFGREGLKIYGPVAHQLTFAEAARRGLICHYRVIISVVTSGMVNDHLLRHGEVLVKGDAVQAGRSRRWKCSRSRANSRAFIASTFAFPTVKPASSSASRARAASTSARSSFRSCCS